MANDQELRRIIREEINNTNNSSQFGVTDIPFHIHNTIDAAAVPGQFIDFSNFMVWGNTTFSSTSDVTITNPNILPTSTILVTSTLQYFSTLSAVCSTGSAYIAGGTSGAGVNYLIIF